MGHHANCVETRRVKKLFYLIKTVVSRAGFLTGFELKFVKMFRACIQNFFITFRATISFCYVYSAIVDNFVIVSFFLRNILFPSIVVD